MSKHLENLLNDEFAVVWPADEMPAAIGLVSF